MLGQLMNTAMKSVIAKVVVAAAGLAVTAGLAGAPIAIADPTPETAVSVQPGDGSSVDTDGTQGQIQGPLDMAKPQIKASATQDRP